MPQRMAEECSSWGRVRLGDVCEILDSRRRPITQKNRVAGNIPYYGATGIVDYVDNYIFDERLVLLGEDGAKWGAGERSAFIIEGKTWVNNHAHVLRPDKSLDDSFLVYFLNYSDLTGFITGVTVPKLNQKNMCEVQIPLPPLAEQKRIAEELDNICAAKKDAEAIVEKLKLLAKSLFVEMFGDLNVNSKGWQSDRLGGVCDVRDGTHASPKYHDVGYPLMTSKNFANGYEDFSDVKLISEEDFLEINKRSKVEAGDIVMPMIGTIGHPVIVRAEREYAIKNVALIKFYEASPCNVYVKAVLESSYFERTVAGTSRGNTQKFIALGDIRSFELPLPPLALQQKFAAFIEQLDKSQFEAQALIGKLDLLYRAKLQEYFG